MDKEQEGNEEEGPEEEDEDEEIIQEVIGNDASPNKKDKDKSKSNKLLKSFDSTFYDFEKDYIASLEVRNKCIAENMQRRSEIIFEKNFHKIMKNL